MTAMLTCQRCNGRGFFWECIDSLSNMVPCENCRHRGTVDVEVDGCGMAAVDGMAVVFATGKG